jgi:type I restriction enzyme R subunit
VPIYYESRNVPLAIGDEALVDAVEETLGSEEDEAAARLITAEAQLDRVVGAGDRIERVADDIARHFTERQKTLEGKAMVVGMTRRICSQLTDQLRDRLGDKAVTCVITASADEEEMLNRWRRSKQEMRQVADEFKDPESPLRIVVVQNMWLTGFDVPPLHTLYIDRPMKDHGLLQAIARVNRVFRDKPGGLVVDYIGIGEDLRAALPAYTPEEVEGSMVPLEAVIAKLREKHEVLAEFFHGIDFRSRHDLPPTELATMFGAVVGKLLADDETTERYLTEHASFSKLFALVSPDPTATELADDAAWFSDVAKAARKLAPPKYEVSPAARQAVKQFFSEGLAAGEIVDVFSIAESDRPEVSVLSDEFLDSLGERVPSQDLQVALMKKLLNDEIRTSRQRNRMQAKLFSDELADLLARYHNRQLTSAEIVEALVELAKKMRAARKRHEELGLTEEEAAFYDALAGQPEDWKADEQLVAIAKELVSNIKADLSVDWTSHESAEAAIRVKVKRLLRKHHYQPPAASTGGGGGKPLDVAADLVLDQARSLYRNWPDIGVRREAALV